MTKEPAGFNPPLEFRFVVKVQRELRQQQDVRRILVYSEDRDFEWILPCGLCEELDEASAYEAKFYCFATVRDGFLDILTHDRPDVAPTW